MGLPEELSSRTPYRVLDQTGTLVGDREVPLDDDGLRSMYSDMRLARRLDERGLSLQRQGRFGIYGEVAGQEAGLVASTHALRSDDWLVPSYREYPALRAHGLPLRYLFAWFMGHAAGNDIPADCHVLPLCIPVATQLPHAVGIAYGAKHADTDRAVLVHFGDGATSEGDFHESANFAGVFDLPVVFFCNNNQWAISTPPDRQTASDSLAVKARAYGFDGVRVDGMDPLAVYEVTRWARERATDDSETAAPTLIEAVEYRFGAHSTADDPSTYRDADEVERWRERDPLARFESFLRARGVLDDGDLAAMDERIEAEVSTELEAAEELTDAPEELFEHVFETPTPALSEQATTLAAGRDRDGE